MHTPFLVHDMGDVWEMGFRSLSAAETDTASKHRSRHCAINAPDKTATVVPAISFRRSAQPGAAPSRGLSSGRAAWPNGVAADRRGCFSRPRRSRYRRPRHLRLDDGGPKARASVILWGNGERTLATAVGGPAHVVRGANLKQPIAIPRGRNIPCWCFPDPGNEESQREAGFLNLVGGTGIEPVTPAV